MDPMRQEKNVPLGSSNNQTFVQLLRIALLPSAITAVLVFGLYLWEHLDPNRFTGQSFMAFSWGLHLVSLVSLTMYFLQRGIPKQKIVILMMIVGATIGLLAAIGKLFLLFRLWALFRLIAEPITLGVVGSAIAYVVSRRRGMVE